MTTESKPSWMYDEDGTLIGIKPWQEAEAEFQARQSVAGLTPDEEVAFLESIGVETDAQFEISWRTFVLVAGVAILASATSIIVAYLSH